MWRNTPSYAYPNIKHAQKVLHCMWSTLNYLQSNFLSFWYQVTSPEQLVQSTLWKMYHHYHQQQWWRTLLCTQSSLWEWEFVFHPISNLQFFNHLLSKKVRRKCSGKEEKESSRLYAVPTPVTVIAPLCAGGWRNHYTDVLWRGHFHFVFPMRDRFMVQGSLHSVLKENRSYHIPQHTNEAVCTVAFVHLNKTNFTVLSFLWLS